MRKRLHAAGCSFTYGDGLQDCWIPEIGEAGKKPSKLAWPTLLGQKLDIQANNLAVPGGSNILAISKLLEANLRSGDIVIVLWTFFTRREFFGKTRAGEWNKTYFDLISSLSCNTDVIMTNLIDIHNFTTYLTSINVNVYYMFVDKFTRSEVDPYFHKLFDKLLPEVMKYSINEDTYVPIQAMFQRGQIKPGLDGGHPGEEWHSLIAERIYRLYFKGMVEQKSLL